MTYSCRLTRHLISARSRQHDRPAETKPDSMICTQSHMQHLSQISGFLKTTASKNEAKCFPYSNENNMLF